MINDFINIEESTFYGEINVTLDLAEYYQKEFEMEYWYFNHDEEYQSKLLTIQEADESKSTDNKIVTAAKKVWEWIKKAVRKIADWFKSVWKKIFGDAKIKQTNDNIDEIKNTVENTPEIVDVLKNVEDALVEKKSTSSGGSDTKTEFFTYKTTESYVQESLTGLAVSTGALAIVKFFVTLGTGGLGNYITAGSIATDNKNIRNIKPIKYYRKASLEAQNIENISVGVGSLLGLNKGFVLDNLHKIWNPSTNELFGTQIMSWFPKLFHMDAHLGLNAQKIFCGTKYALGFGNLIPVAVLIDWIIKTIKDLKNPNTHNRNIIDAAFETAVTTAYKIFDICSENTKQNEIAFNKTLSAVLNDDVKKQEEALQHLDELFRSEGGLLKLVNSSYWTSTVQSRHLNALHKAINAIDANLNDRDSYLGKIAMGVMDKAGMNNLPNNHGSATVNVDYKSTGKESHLIDEHAVLTKLLIKFARNCSDLVMIGQGCAGIVHDYMAFTKNLFKNILIWHHGVIANANANNEHISRISNNHTVNAEFKKNMAEDEAKLKTDVKHDVNAIKRGSKNIAHKTKDKLDNVATALNKNGASPEAVPT